MVARKKETKQFAFILHVDEWQMLRTVAAAHGKSGAEWLRQKIRGEFGALTPKARRVVADYDKLRGVT